MKNILFLAFMATLTVSCNDSSRDSSNDHNTTAHANHDTASAGSHDNAMTETMNKMMHEMHNAKTTGNNNIDFASMMIEHHKGAVEMAKLELDKGTNRELKTFAQKVIDDQNKEIAFMQQFLAKADKTASANTAEFQKAMNASMMSMMNDNTTVYNHIDKDFAAQMIPHHKAAVDMAKAYLQFEKEPGLTTLSRNIISAQEKEITWLKDWLAKNAK